MKRIALIIAAAALLSAPAYAQSSQFTLGKWVEVHNAILKELNRSYVDSLEVGRIERAAVDAMLDALDPYTVYVPEEEQENFQMMLTSAYGGIGAIIYKPDINGNVIINEPYEGSPAARAGLRCGDEIELIDGVTTHGLESGECTEKMRGKPGTDVVFHVKKVSGEMVDVTVRRERIVLPSIEYVGMLNEADGYVMMSKFTEGVGQGIRDAVLKLKKQKGKPAMSWILLWKASILPIPCRPCLPLCRRWGCLPIPSKKTCLKVYLSKCVTGLIQKQGFPLKSKKISQSWEKPFSMQ